MSQNADILPTRGFEGQRVEFRPENNPAMRQVLVKTEMQPGLEFKQPGWMTDIPGAKVDLHVLTEQNRRREYASYGDNKIYRQIYFTTASGTIYEAVSKDKDASWRIRASTTDRENMIREAATLEVGKRFQSPHVINGQPELDTSPVQRIIIVEEKKRRHAAALETNIDGAEVTDIGTQFLQAGRKRDGL